MPAFIEDHGVYIKDWANGLYGSTPFISSNFLICLPYLFCHLHGPFDYTENVFYKYVFYYINYQSYVFRALISKEFATRTYFCGNACYCMCTSALSDRFLIDGKLVMAEFGFEVVNRVYGLA